MVPVFYEQTRPPLSKAMIDTLTGKLERAKISKIDRVVLANLIRTCYELGLKRRQLIDLSIGDVAERGIVGKYIQVSGSQTVGSEAREKMGKPLEKGAWRMIQIHLNYLKEKRYRRYRTSPLFPTREKVRFTESTLAKHLEKALKAINETEDRNAAAGYGNGNNFNADILLDKIRQAGICAYYDRLRAQGLSPSQCLKQTKEFAGIKRVPHLRNLLRGQIQITGKKTNPVAKYLEQIEAAERSGNPYARRKAYDRISRAIADDPKLSTRQKRELELIIER
jgi:hypothetical protein